MRREWWIAALVAVLTLVSGCGGSHNQNSTNLRALNAVVDAEALDVLVDDSVQVSALAVGSTSAYSSLSSGTRDVKVRSATLGTVLVDKSLGLASGANSTLVMYGKRSAIATLLLSDDTTSPSSGKFKIRAAGLSPDAGPVDLYVVSGDIASSPAALSSVTFAATTDYVEIPEGSYQLVFAAAGTKEVLFQSSAQTLAAGAMLTMAAFPSAGGRLVNGVLLKSGSDASGTFFPNPLGRLKAVNAVPDSSAFNFKADGVTLLSNVPFAGSSSYVTVASGARALGLEASNVPGPLLASLTQQIDPAKDYSAVAVNNLGAVELVAFSDDNSLPPAGFAKVRFANAMVDSTTVDVLVNFASQASGIAYKSASAYYPLAASTTYTLTFATPGGISVIATLTPVELDAGVVYTAYLMGNATSPQLRLVRDR